MTRRRYPESALQMQTAQIMRTCLRQGAFAHHSPNERESRAQRRIQAAHGTIPGFPDWVIFAPYPIRATGPIHPTQWVCRAWSIELKHGRRDQTPAQEDFEALCGAAAMPYRVCRSVDEVLEALDDWGLLRPGVHVERRTAGGSR